MAGIVLRGIGKRYGQGAAVLRGIDLEIADGEFAVFVGPSGCGKSTVLRMIAGLEAVSEGELLIGGRIANRIPPAERGVAMVFQSYALYPHMTVYENMAFSLRMARRRGAEIDAAVREAADILQIGPLLQRRPGELSGGQRQRVAIGRAIVRRPQVFLFDEPLSNLDAALRVQMRMELARLHRELKTTMVYVTHDQVEAMTLGQTIAVFHDGAIAQTGAPRTLYDAPADRFVAGFLGAPAMNFLDGTLAAAGPEGADVRLADGTVLRAAVPAAGARSGDAVTLGIRAEHLAIGPWTPDAPGLRATLRHVEYLGETAVGYAESSASPAGRLLAVRLSPGDAPAVGAAVVLRAAPQHCHLFGADGRAFARGRTAP